VDETESELSRQLSDVQTLLNDPAPAVRAAAAHGTARILSLFWDALPHDSKVLCSLPLSSVQSYFLILLHSPHPHTYVALNKFSAGSNRSRFP
jgi:hypothetical protein